MLRFLVVVFFLSPFAALGVEPDEMLADPILEARARDVSRELRCVVCLNQDIDSSNAGVARDLRLLVRERLVAGDSNAQAIAFIQVRYGDYVMLKPPFKPRTYALWLAPPLLLFLALVIGFLTLRRVSRQATPKGLSEAEEQEIEAFINEQEVGPYT